jgi:hypothetical protein
MKIIHIFSRYTTYVLVLNCSRQYQKGLEKHHHRQPINIPTAGARENEP